LIERGADPTIRDDQRERVLQLAAEFEKNTVMQLLLEKETDIAMQDNNDQMALHQTAR
jgi:ankyrin repeat protein